MMAHHALPTPTFCSPLAAALERFLEGKRAAGYRYRDEARALGVLDRFLAHTLVPSDPVLTTEIARAFVARQGDESETTRQHRLSLVREVCRFLVLEQPRTAVPGPRWLGIHRRVFVPRVLSHDEGHRFLQACQTLASRHGSPTLTLIWRPRFCASGIRSSANPAWCPSPLMSPRVSRGAGGPSLTTSATAGQRPRSLRDPQVGSTRFQPFAEPFIRCWPMPASLVAAAHALSGFTICGTPLLSSG